MQADLPLDLEDFVGQQLHCSLPPRYLRRRGSSLAGENGVDATAIDEDSYEEDTSVFTFGPNAGCIGISDENLEDAFDEFFYKLDGLVTLKLYYTACIWWYYLGPKGCR